MYLTQLQSIARGLHFLPAIEIGAVIDQRLSLLERDERLQIPHSYDARELSASLMRLKKYVFGPGVPVGTTEDEIHIFAEVLGKMLD
jgi:hypothetical protein